MDLISKVLFGIANSLLIPDVILLILLFIWSIMMLGAFYAQFTTKKKNDKSLLPLIDGIKKGTNTIEELRQALPQKNTSLFIAYLRDILDYGADEDRAEYILSDFENRVNKDLAKSRLLSKVGPVLGLIGTLIAMSPALVGLSAGDIGAMAYNMQVVFATTVVGLVISMVGLLTLLYKQRWYEKDTNVLIFVSRLMQTK